MIFNRPRRREKKRLKWYFNSEIRVSRDVTYSGAFTCGRVTYTSIRLSTGMGVMMTYGNKLGVYATLRGGWISESYRTIVFAEEPTGGLLAFLEANATPQ